MNYIDRVRYMDNQDKYIKQLKETLGVIDKDNQNMQKEKIYLKEKINNLQQRIDKAVEYILDEGITFLNIAEQRTWCGKHSCEDLLNILKGSDTND